MRPFFNIFIFAISTCCTLHAIQANGKELLAEHCELDGNNPNSEQVRQDFPDGGWQTILCHCPPRWRKQALRTSVTPEPNGNSLKQVWFRCASPHASASVSRTEEPDVDAQVPTDEKTTDYSTSTSTKRVAGNLFDRQALAIGALGLGAVLIVAGAPVFATVSIGWGVAMAFSGVGLAFSGYALYKSSFSAPIQRIDEVKDFVVH